MILESGAIECNLFHSLGLGFFGNALADQGSRLDVAAVADFLAYIGFKRRRGGEYFRGGIDHLRIYMVIGAVNRKPHRLELRDLGAGLAGTAHTRLFLVNHGRQLRYFFLVSFSTTRSSE